jgi:ribosomal protein L11 methyltransferase
MNVLLLDISVFSKLLKDNGRLFLSGFYTQDIPAIEAKANQNGLHLVEFKEKDNWVSAHFSKSNG